MPLTIRIPFGGNWRSRHYGLPAITAVAVATTAMSWDLPPSADTWQAHVTYWTALPLVGAGLFLTTAHDTGALCERCGVVPSRRRGPGSIAWSAQRGGADLVFLARATLSPHWRPIVNVELLNPADFGQPIAVITGGWSRERDRSLLSGRTVTGSLTSQGIEARVVDLETDRETLVDNLAGASLAFLAIAGRGAEDGRLQGLLETLGIDYTGSGVRASALGMHKPLAKTVVATAGVPVPAGTMVDLTRGTQCEVDRITRLLGLPVIVKPASEGGSIGLRIAGGSDQLAVAIGQVAEHEVMAERFHPGRSISVGVLEDHGTLRVLPALEVETTDGVYTYEAKRAQADCRYHCPARVSPEVQHALRRQAFAAHRALGCHSYSRHDFIVTAADEVLWLEVNTLPGLSASGNLARMATSYGLTYDQLIAHIVRGARVERRAQS
ncbi:D-alanine--D-alanine ligase [Streptomyces sp. NPDC020096]